MGLKNYTISYISSCPNTTIIGTKIVKAISNSQALKVFNRDFVTKSVRDISSITVNKHD